MAEQQNHPFKLSFNRSSKVDLQGSHAAWRTLVALLVISGVVGRCLGGIEYRGLAGLHSREIISY